MADVDSGQPFAANESLTNIKLHNLFDNATVDSFVRADLTNATSPIHIAASAPTVSPTPIAGNVWYDTTNAFLRIYDGTDWVPWSRGWAYTNRSGSSVVAGDIVIIDTGNASSVTKTTAASSTNVFGVVLVGGADTAKVIVSTEGRVPTVNVDGATAIGDYLFTGTTSGSATPSSTLAEGAIGRALTSTAGVGTVSAQLGGGILAGASAGFKWSAVDVVSFSRSISSSGTQSSIAHSLGMVPKMVLGTSYLTPGGVIGHPAGQCVIINGTVTAQHVTTVAHNRAARVHSTSHTFIGANDASNYNAGAISAPTSSDFDVVWSVTGSPTTFTVNCRAILVA
jgi:hypothetical protein